MSSWKKWLAACMTALLLLTSAPVYAAEGAPQEPQPEYGAAGGAAGAAADYVRILNKWQSNYLYEASDGTVRYGRTAYDDETSQWQLEAADGGTRIRNRATGHYITVAETAKRRDALKARAIDAGTAADRWLIEDASRPGYKVIKSATAGSSANLVIHEEDQLGYAEVSDDINITFESPQWMLQPVGTRPVVIASKGRAGQFLYEAANPYPKDRPADVAAYGRVDPTSPIAQWDMEVVDPGDGSAASVRLRNHATGKYLTQMNEDDWRAVELTDADGAELSRWQLEGSVSEGFVRLRNVGQPGNLLHAQESSDSYARANNWAGDGYDNVYAQWQILPAPDTRPMRIVGYTTAQVGTDYLAAAMDGSVSHGALGADLSYEWVPEDYDGAKRLRNLGTGRYLSAGDPLTAGEPTSVAAGVYQWQLAPSDIYDDYLNIAAGDGSGYLLLQDGALKTAAANPEADGAQWLLEDPYGGVSGDQYVRIQNEWQPFVWYEDENGDLKYGNPRQDKRDQWLIEKFQGRKRIKNRATGHYVNLQNMTDGHIRVTDVEDDWTSAIWVVETLGSGSKLFYNVADRVKGQDVQKLINLQNLNKYAEYAAINRNWGSPRWTLIPVGEDAGPSHLRFVNGAGQALYEETAGDKAGLVRYGEKDAADLTAVWYIEDAGNSAKRLKNTATGHYIAMENMAGHETEDAPDLPLGTEAVIYEAWGSAKWYLETAPDSDEIALRSGWAGHYVYTDGAGGTKVSKTVKDGDGSFADSALFKAEPVDLPSVLPDGFIRIQNEANGQYLYENRGGVVLYGSIAEDNGYSHWKLESTGGGGTKIVNRATGHAMALTPDYRYIESQPQPTGGSTGDSAFAWSVEASASAAGKWLIRSLAAGFDDEYVNVGGAAGYAERGLVPVTFATARWSFAAAPEAYTTPNEDGDVNNNTGTPVQNDTAYIRIGSGQGAWLTETETGSESATGTGAGAVKLTQATAEDARAQWLLQDFNGRKLVQNRASGRLLALDANGAPTVVSAESRSLAAQWTVEETQGLLELSNAASEAAGGRLLHAGTEASYGPAAPAGTDTSATSAETARQRWTYERLPGDVRYEAEDAFMDGGLKPQTAQANYTGTGYAAGWSADGSAGKLTFTVNAQSAGSYEAVIRYAVNAGGAPATLALSVNGLPAGQLALPATGGGWQTQRQQIELRAGINTLSLQPAAAGGAAQLAIDSLTLADSVAPAYRGATTPYTTYEAEQADTNAAILRASRALYDPAAEASGRQAVKLSATGDYVSFTLAHPANSIVLRYSLPDSADGAGRTETLGLYVDGQFRQKLTLSSKYAWEYGSYPWSNDPTQGSGHRFFDEIHALIGDVPAGAKVSLVKDDASHSPYYTIDLADFELAAAPLEKPEGFVDVRDYGATADDGSDDTAAFKAAMAAAKAEGKGVWFPEGEFGLGDGLLDLDLIQIRGAGMWYTQLTGAKFVGRGSEIGVYDLLIDGDINERDDEAITNAFHGGFGPGSVLQNVWIEHTKAGLWLTKVKDGEEYTSGLHMVGLRMRDLMADGINFSVGTTDSMLEQSDVRYPGDDGIAMWSTDGRSSVNNTARFNTVSLPWLANNIAVFGGTDNKIQDNVAKDTIINGSGITVSTRFNPLPFAGTTVVERNTLIRTGSYDTGLLENLGAIWLYLDTKNMTGEVVVRDNVAQDSTYNGIIVNGTQSAAGRLLLQNIVLDGAGVSGVSVGQAVSGTAEVDNVIVRGARIENVANASAAFRLSEINEGFASSPKPFAVAAAEGGPNGFVLTAGKASALKVTDREGHEVTAQATFTADDAAIATVGADGLLTGVAAGATRLKVAYGGAERVYTVQVSAAAKTPDSPGSGSSGSSGGTDGETSTADNDAQLRLKAAAGEDIIVIQTGRDGKAAFSAQALLAAAASRPDAVLRIESGDVAYDFPLSLAVKLLKARGLENDANAVWTFEARALDDASSAPIAADAQRQGLKLAAPPVQFGITLHSGDGKTETIDDFGGVYVERTIKVAGKLDEAGSVAVVYSPGVAGGEGSFAPVPALFETATDGGTLVTVRSPGNSVYVIAEHQASFTDLSNHWAKQDIERLASKLIVKGDGNGVFGPKRSITRAEFAALLVRGLGLRDPGGDTGFSDVSAAAWYAADVRTAAHYGLVQGNGDGTFRPQADITREQIAVMAAQALKLANAAALADAQPRTAFGDAADIHGWAAAAVDAASALGIVKGLPDGGFAPRAAATRAEAAVMLARVLAVADLSKPTE